MLLLSVLCLILSASASFSVSFSPYPYPLLLSLSNLLSPCHAAKQKKLTMVFGVTIPCILSIFSVILFLRLGFVLGQVSSQWLAWYMYLQPVCVLLRIRKPQYRLLSHNKEPSYHYLSRKHFCSMHLFGKVGSDISSWGLYVLGSHPCCGQVIS